MKEAEEEMWMCDKCGCKGKKSALGEGNKCPECDAVPPEVHKV